MKTITKKIVTILLVVSMMFTPCLNAFAVEPEIKDLGFANASINENYQILNTINGEQKILQDKSISVNGRNKQISVNIVSDNNIQISNVEITSAYDRAMSAYSCEMEAKGSAEAIGTFNYMLLGEDEVYFYEQTANEPLNAEMQVFVLSENDKTEM